MQFLVMSKSIKLDRTFNRSYSITSTLIFKLLRIHVRKKAEKIKILRPINRYEECLKDFLR